MKDALEEEGLGLLHAAQSIRSLLRPDPDLSEEESELRSEAGAMLLALALRHQKECVSLMRSLEAMLRAALS